MCVRVCVRACMSVNAHTLTGMQPTHFLCTWQKVFVVDFVCLDVSCVCLSGRVLCLVMYEGTNGWMSGQAIVSLFVYLVTISLSLSLSLCLAAVWFVLN